MKGEKVIIVDDVEFVDSQMVANYYGVSNKIVLKWVEDGKISGKQLSDGKYIIPKDEYDYLKQKRDEDQTGGAIKELLGEDYIGDWEVEIDD